MRVRIVLLVLAASVLVLASVLAALWVLLRLQSHTWLVLGCVGLGALVVSGVIATLITRSLVRPLADVATTADRLAAGTCPPAPRRPGRPRYAARAPA